MMKAVRSMLMLALVLGVVAPVLAQDKPGRKEGKRPRPERRKAVQVLPMRLLQDVDLTAEQKAKLEELKKEMTPKLAEIRKQMQGIMTDEQKKARGEAMKAAKAAGKEGKDLRDAVQAAIKPTDEQKAKMAEVQKAMGELQKQLREKVMELLTPEQKEAVKERMKKARGEGRKRGEGKAAAEK